MNRVFVYGTLKRGQRNQHFMHGAEFLGQHRTEKIYSMYEFEDYPAVCLCGSQAITGEVYHITDSSGCSTTSNGIRTFTSAPKFLPAGATPGCTSSN